MKAKLIINYGSWTGLPEPSGTKQEKEIVVSEGERLPGNFLHAQAVVTKIAEDKITLETSNYITDQWLEEKRKTATTNKPDYSNLQWKLRKSETLFLTNPPMTDYGYHLRISFVETEKTA